MKTTKRPYAIIPLAVLLMTASCAERLTGWFERVPINLTATVAEGELTRAGNAVQTSQFDTGQTFYAYFPANVTETSTLYQITNADGETQIAEGSEQPYFESGETQATVHAYYPPSKVSQSSTSFSVEQDQSTDGNYMLSDLMYATANIVNDHTYIVVTQGLTFRHLMSKIMVVVTAGQDVAKIQEVRIVGGYKTIAMTAPACQLGTTASDLTDALTTDSYVTMCKNNDAATASCSALIPPQTINGAFLWVKADGKWVYYTLNNKTFESGRSYLFTMTVNKAAIGTTIGIGGWDASGNTTINPTVLYGGTLDIRGDVKTEYHEYTGDPIVPNFTVRDTKTNQDITSSDYDATFYNNTNAGEAMLFIQGKGDNYSDAYGFTRFTIEKQPINGETTMATIADIASRSYTGSAYEPALSVTSYVGKSLVAGTDYTTVYSGDHTNAGTYTATITGIGNYMGEQSKDYSIARAASSMSFSPMSFAFLPTEPESTSTTLTIVGEGAITISSNDSEIASVTTTSIAAGYDREPQTVSFTSGTKVGTATITALMEEYGNHLAGSATFTVKVLESKLELNPLWRVAQYNVQSSGSFAESHNTSSPPVWNFTEAQTIGASISGYHLPTMKEQASIIPMDHTTSQGTNVWGLTGTLDNPTSFLEITCTVNGADVAASTSYIGRNAANDYYAVRFIGTSYASAWHYKWLTSPCYGLLIESYLISSSMTASEAQDLLATLASSEIFTGTADAGTANQTPESTDDTNGFVQRFLPACGFNFGSNGTADNSVGSRGYYWSSTAVSSRSFYMYFRNNGTLDEHYGDQTSGFSVRLFRDN